MSKTLQLENRTAVVTGAASGIGRGLALVLARRGCHLALADIDEAGLEQTAKLVATAGLRVSTHRLDVGDAAAVAAFPGVVRDVHPGVDLLFNNAGVALGGTFEQLSAEDFDWLFGINFWGVVRMTRAFLPLLRASDDGWIANVSSVYGLAGPPGQTAYAASKFAVRGFSEALRHELEGSNVGVTVVHPGGVATSIADNARVPAGADPEEVARERAAINKFLTMPAEDAAEAIVRAVERRQPRLLVGANSTLVDRLVRLAPASYWSLLTRLAR